MTYELHPLCTLFPRLDDGAFAALVADIKVNGLREPITLHGGMVLDGGNRYRACLAAGVEPVFAEFSGGNAVSFVLSANLHRRHLSPGQQAAIVASAKDWANAQKHGGARRGDQVATLPLETLRARAAESGAGERTQRMADKVAKADPALAKKVGHGEISLPKALAKVEGREAAPPKPAAPADDDGEDLHQMLTEMQRECETYARRMADWERAMTTEGKAALLTAIKRYEHAEREKALTDERAASYMKQRDQALRTIRAIGKAVGEDDPDKVLAAVRKAVAEEA